MQGVGLQKDRVPLSAGFCLSLFSPCSGVPPTIGVLSDSALVADSPLPLGLRRRKAARPNEGGRECSSSNGASVGGRLQGGLCVGGGGAGPRHSFIRNDLGARPFIRFVIHIICPLRAEMYFPERSLSRCLSAGSPGCPTSDHQGRDLNDTSPKLRQSHLGEKQLEDI